MKVFFLLFIFSSLALVCAEDEIKMKDLNNSETNYQNTGDLAEASSASAASTGSPGVSKEQLDTLKLQINQIKDNQKQSDEFLIELEKDM
jgi:hypothetical protein